MAAKPLAANQSMPVSLRMAMASKEIIITRTKSAQLKRQLRSADKAIELPKGLDIFKIPAAKPRIPSPSTYRNATVAKQKTAPKSTKPAPALVPGTSLLKIPRKRKAVENDDGDYYPSKQKRKINRNRVTLKPKHELTKVHSLNKRKRTTPRKGVPSNAQTAPPSEPAPKPVPPPAPELAPAPKPTTVKAPTMSMVDMVNACDHEDSLTNEDLLEILTCPSPVWWEDPINSMYREDPIPMLRKKAADRRLATQSQEHPINVTNKDGTSAAHTSTNERQGYKVSEKLVPVDIEISSQIKLSGRDGKFIKKRSSLENILHSIKTKTTCIKSSTQFTKNANLLGSPDDQTTDSSTKFDSIDKVIQDDRKSRLKHKPTILKNESKLLDDLIDLTTDSNTGSNEDLFADARDAQILSDLENLDIPIETTNTSVKQNPTLNEPMACIILEDDDETCCSFIDGIQISPVEDNMEAKLIEGSEELTLPEKYKTFVPPASFSSPKIVWSAKDENNKSKIRDSDKISKDVPDDMPPLTKYSKIVEGKVEIPANFKFESSESDIESSSLQSSQDVDTISDTNIKFLSDDQISDYEVIEGDRLKFNKDMDSGICVGEDDKVSSVEVKYKSEEKEKEPTLVKDETDESNHEVARINEISQTNTNDIESADPEIKKDCILVYRIIESVSEPNVDATDGDFSHKTKSVVKTRRSANPTKQKYITSGVKTEDQQTSIDNIDDFFKVCKKANFKTAPGKKTKAKVQNSSKNVNRSKVVGKTKKGCEEDTAVDDKKPIALSDTKTVNYCLKCSSIFDTDACNYCVIKT